VQHNKESESNILNILLLLLLYNCVVSIYTVVCALFRGSAATIAEYYSNFIFVD
jgi:hypothetical protein